MNQSSKQKTNKTDHEDGDDSGEDLTVRLLDNQDYTLQNEDSQLKFIPSDADQFDSIDLQSPAPALTAKKQMQNQHYMAPNLLGNQTDPSYSNGEESDAMFYDARTHTDQGSDIETFAAKTTRSKQTSRYDKDDALMLIDEEEKKDE